MKTQESIINFKKENNLINFGGFKVVSSLF